MESEANLASGHVAALALSSLTRPDRLQQGEVIAQTMAESLRAARL